MTLSLALEIAASLTQIATLAFNKAKAGDIAAGVLTTASAALRDAKLVTDMVAFAQADDRPFTETEVATLIEMRRAALRELDVQLGAE